MTTLKEKERKPELRLLLLRQKPTVNLIHKIDAQVVARRMQKLGDWKGHSKMELLYLSSKIWPLGPASW